MLQRVIPTVLMIVLSCVFSAASVADGNAPDRQINPIANEGAEIFGLKVNDLSKKTFEKRLGEMGIEPYPSYKKDVVSYSLGDNGILGLKELDATFNDYGYIKQATMVGVVKSNDKRSSLGNLLVKKYGEPNIGFVKDGYGRAKWVFQDGTYIELHNTTFDVSVIYVDQDPKIPSESGQIDVEALYKETHKPKS